MNLIYIHYLDEYLSSRLDIPLQLGTYSALKVTWLPKDCRLGMAHRNAAEQVTWMASEYEVAPGEASEHIRLKTRDPLQQLLYARSPSSTTMWKYRGVAQFGSAGALGALGRRFESCRPDWFLSDCL